MVNGLGRDRTGDGDASAFGRGERAGAEARATGSDEAAERPAESAEIDATVVGELRCRLCVSSESMRLTKSLVSGSGIDGSSCPGMVVYVASMKRDSITSTLIFAGSYPERAIRGTVLLARVVRDDLRLLNYLHLKALGNAVSQDEISHMVQADTEGVDCRTPPPVCK